MTHSRTTRTLAAIATMFALAGPVLPPHSFAADLPQSTIPGKPAPEATDVAAPRRDRDFLQRHESFLKRGKEGPIGLLFLGDSITAGWAWAARDLWHQNSVPTSPPTSASQAIQNIMVFRQAEKR